VSSCCNGFMGATQVRCGGCGNEHCSAVTTDAPTDKPTDAPTAADVGASVGAWVSSTFEGADVVHQWVHGCRLRSKALTSVHQWVRPDAPTAAP
jgi:hypothetical protein